MKDLKQLQQRLSTKGDKQLYADSNGNKLMLSEFFQRLTWIQLIDEDFSSSAKESYMYNSNMGSFKIHFYTPSDWSISHFYFSDDGSNWGMRDNEVFKLQDIVNQPLPKQLQERIAEAVKNGSKLNFADAKRYIWHLHLKSEQQYYEWYDSYKPNFLPRNADEYYSVNK